MSAGRELNRIKIEITSGSDSGLELERMAGLYKTEGREGHCVHSAMSKAPIQIY